MYIPQRCIGNKSVPLFVLLHGGGRSGIIELEKFRSLADKHGVMALFPNAMESGTWDVIAEYGSEKTSFSSEQTGLVVSNFNEIDVRMIDSAMKVVLATNAIDPDRIALLGFSNGGGYSLFLGRSNLDIFSRIASLSGLFPFDGVGPHNRSTQFLLSGGIGEGGMDRQTLKLAQILRSQGHTVVSQIGLRGHVDHLADEEFVWSWIINSWADSSITNSMKPKWNEDTLSIENIKSMVDFLNRFRSLPAEITT